MGCSGSRVVSLATQTSTLQQNYALTNADIRAPYKLFTKILEKANKQKIKLHAAIQPSTTLKLVDIRLAFNFGRSILTEHWFECGKINDINAVTFPEFLYLCTIISLCDRKSLITFLYYSLPLNKENNFISLQALFKALLVLQESFTEIPLPIDILHDQLKQIVIASPAPIPSITSTPVIPMTARGTDTSSLTSSSTSSPVTSLPTHDTDGIPTDDTLMVTFDHFYQLINQHTSLYNLCSTFQDSIATKSRTKVEWLNTRQHLLKISPNILADLTELMKFKNLNKSVEVIETHNTHHNKHSRKASQVPSARRRKATEYLESLHETIATELNATKKLTQIEDPLNKDSSAVAPPAKDSSVNEPSYHTRNMSSKIAPLQLKRLPSSTGEGPNTAKPSLAQPLRTERSARRHFNNDNDGAREPSRLANKASTTEPSSDEHVRTSITDIQATAHREPASPTKSKSRSKRRSMSIGAALTARHSG